MKEVGGERVAGSLGSACLMSALLGLDAHDGRRMSVWFACDGYLHFRSLNRQFSHDGLVSWHCWVLVLGFDRVGQPP